MKKIILILTVLTYGTVYGQEKLLKLKNEPINIAIKDFYISDVIDDRSNKNNIGFAQVGMFNKAVSANLDGGIEKALYEYLKYSLQQDTTTTPITLKITHLNISEKTTFSSETGRAEINVEFYRSTGGKFEKIFETGTIKEEAGMDVTNGHEKRIRDVLTTCLRNFNNSDWKFFTPDSIDSESIIADKPVIAAPGISQVRKEPVKWNSLLTFSKTFGVNAEGWGLSYYGYSTTQNNKWIVPMVISIEGFTIKDDYFSRSNYMKAKLNYWMPGICAFRKLNDNFYINLTFQVPIGSETLTDFYGNESDNFLIGLAPAQGLYFIPKSSFGITFGIGIYEKLLTSEVYKSDIGFKAELGIKF